MFSIFLVQSVKGLNQSCSLAFEVVVLKNTVLLLKLFPVALFNWNNSVPVSLVIGVSRLIVFILNPLKTATVSWHVRPQLCIFLAKTSNFHFMVPVANFIYLSKS